MSGDVQMSSLFTMLYVLSLHNVISLYASTLASRGRVRGLLECKADENNIVHGDVLSIQSASLWETTCSLGSAFICSASATEEGGWNVNSGPLHLSPVFSGYT